MRHVVVSRARPLLAALLVLAVAEAGRAQDAGNRWALLVAVQDYGPPRSGGLSPLRFTGNDVAALRAVLVETLGYPADHVLVLDQSPGRRDDLRPFKSNVERALDGMLRNAGPEDTLIVAFSGHGVQFEGEDTGSYFCPFDADVRHRETLIPLATVRTRLEEQCPARVKLLLVDACREDPVNRNSKGPGTGVLPVARREIGFDRPPRGMAAMFSCSRGEAAEEDPTLRRGIFFHYVIEGLKGAAAGAEAEITVGRLAKYVEARVKEHVFRKNGAITQRPQVVSDDVTALDTLPLFDPGLPRLLEKVRRVLDGRDGIGLDDLAEVIGAMDRVLLRHPRQPKAHALRGMAYLLRAGSARNVPDDLADAIEDLREAVRLDPEDVPARLELGKALLFRGDYPGAVKHYTEAIRREEKSVDAHIGRGQALAIVAPEKALADFDRALTLDPDAAARIHLNRAYALLEMKQPDRALEALREVLAARSKSDHETLVKLHLLRVEAHRSLGRFREAHEDIDELLRMNGRQAVPYRLRGQVYHEMKEYARAIRAFDEALGLDPHDPQAYYGRGLARAARGDHPRAVADLKEAIRKFDGDAGTGIVPAHLALARSLCVLGHFQGAADECGKAIAIDPDDPEPYRVRAEANRALDRPKEAERDHQSFLSRSTRAGVAAQ